MEQERSVQLPEHQPFHHYSDKFSLVEQQTQILWRVLKTLFHRVGVEWGSSSTISNPDGSDATATVAGTVDNAATIPLDRGFHLYWEGKTRCDFVKEVEFEETGDGYKTVQEDEGVYWSTIVTRTTHDSRIVKRFVWNITDHYSLYACTEPCDGGNSSGAYRLQGRTLSTTLATSDRRHCPINDRNVLHSLNMTWWTEQVKQNAYAFSIDRSLESCRTPRRNDNINRAMEFHTRLHQWCTSVIQYLNTIYVSTDDDIACKLRESALEHARTNPDEETLLALVPLFENSTVISGATVDHLLEADQSTIEKKIVDLTYLASRSSSSETNDTYGFSVQEATLEFLLRRMQRAIEQHSLNVDYVEDLLREQLIRAIGRELTSEDFDLFMASHYKAIFRPEFATRPFSHAVRRPNQYPVGIVSIEDEEQSDKAPVQTFSRRIKGESEPPILIPIDAATTIEMTGDRVLSGWIRYSFSSSDSVGSSTIVAHARQFSSYILLIGTMSSANTFEPKNAIVVQNKDVVKIPLLTEVLPSAKEFKNAIASLSPEQQEFARAMRSMQLHSSVFAMCIVQLKPQLERLLNLPENSLAKEIQLTEDLMSLFIEYQIPSDLFSYDGPTEGAVSEKVETVKTYVKQVMQVIQTTKEEKLAEEGMKRKMEDFLAPSSAPSGAPSAAPSGVPSGVPSSAPSGAPSELAREGGGTEKLEISASLLQGAAKYQESMKMKKKTLRRKNKSLEMAHWKMQKPQGPISLRFQRGWTLFWKSRMRALTCGRRF